MGRGFIEDVRKSYDFFIERYGLLILIVWSGVVIFLNIMDILTTWVGVNVAGVQSEINPIARHLLSQGFAHFVIVKIVVVDCVLCGVWFLYFKKWKGWKIVIIILLIYGFLLGVFINNVFVLKNFFEDAKDVLRMLDFFKFVYTLTILVIASVEDIKRREVEDVYWVALLFVAVPSNVEAYFISQSVFSSWMLIVAQLVVLAIFIVVSLAVGHFGGADIKALLCLFIMFPYYPKVFEWVKGSPCLALSSFLNTVIPLAMFVILLFLKNVFKGDFSKCMFIGYKVSIDRIPRNHVLLGKYKGSGEWKCSFRMTEPHEKVLKELRGMGVKEVWVTPLLPYVAFITVGFVLAVCVGDVFMLVVG